MSTTIDTLVAQALIAYATLTELGEEVEDEWSYVQDLSGSWRARLEDIADRRSGAPADEAQVVAIERIGDEVGRITDAHRAIDWLSTFPQVVLLALGDPEPGDARGPDTA